LRNAHGSRFSTAGAVSTFFQGLVTAIGLGGGGGGGEEEDGGEEGGIEIS
jgi:hypothetical protein